MFRQERKLIDKLCRKVLQNYIPKLMRLD